MANAFSLTGRINIFARQADRTLRTIDRQARIAASGLNNAEIAAAQLTRALAGLSAAVMVVKFFEKASTAAREFEAAMRNVNTITQIGGRGFNEFSERVRTLSSEFNLAASPVEAAAAAYDIASAGFTDAADAAEILKQSLIAANAGLTDAKTAASGIIGVLSAYTLGAGEAAHVNDVMFRTVEKGRVTFQELAQFIGTVSPFAAQAGISFEELSASIASASRPMGNVSKTLIGLRGLIVKLTAPTKNARKAMAEMGITINEDTLQANGLIAELKKLNEASGGSVEKMRMIVEDTRALSTALALLRGGGEEVTGFLREFEDKSTTTGAAQRALEEQQKSLEFSLKQLGVEFQTAMTHIGAFVNQFVKPAIDALIIWIKAWNDLPGPIKSFGVALALATGVVLLFTAAVVAANAAVALVAMSGFATGLSSLASTGGMATRAVTTLSGSWSTLSMAAGPLRTALSQASIGMSIVKDSVGQLITRSLSAPTALGGLSNGFKAIRTGLSGIGPGLAGVGSGIAAVGPAVLAVLGPILLWVAALTGLFLLIKKIIDVNNDYKQQQAQLENQTAENTAVLKTNKKALMELREAGFKVHKMNLERIRSAQQALMAERFLVEQELAKEGDPDRKKWLQDRLDNIERDIDATVQAHKDKIDLVGNAEERAAALEAEDAKNKAIAKLEEEALLAFEDFQTKRKRGYFATAKEARRAFALIKSSYQAALDSNIELREKFTDEEVSLVRGAASQLMAETQRKISQEEAAIAEKARGKDDAIAIELEGRKKLLSDLDWMESNAVMAAEGNAEEIYQIRQRFAEMRLAMETKINRLLEKGEEEKITDAMEAGSKILDVRKAEATSKQLLGKETLKQAITAEKALVAALEAQQVEALKLVGLTEEEKEKIRKHYRKLIRQANGRLAKANKAKSDDEIKRAKDEFDAKKDLHEAELRLSKTRVRALTRDKDNLVKNTKAIIAELEEQLRIRLEMIDADEQAALAATGLSADQQNAIKATARVQREEANQDIDSQIERAGTQRTEGLNRQDSAEADLASARIDQIDDMIDRLEEEGKTGVDVQKKIIDLLKKRAALELAILEMKKRQIETSNHPEAVKAAKLAVLEMERMKILGKTAEEIKKVEDAAKSLSNTLGGAVIGGVEEMAKSMSDGTFLGKKVGTGTTLNTDEASRNKALEGLSKTLPTVSTSADTDITKNAGSGLDVGAKTIQEVGKRQVDQMQKAEAPASTTSTSASSTTDTNVRLTIDMDGKVEVKTGGDVFAPGTMEALGRDLSRHARAEGDFPGGTGKAP